MLFIILFHLLLFLCYVTLVFTSTIFIFHQETITANSTIVKIPETLMIRYLHLIIYDTAYLLMYSINILIEQRK